jgi:release factor glutamine methyltransferase
MASVAQLLELGSELVVAMPRLEAELLLAHCLEKPRSYCYAWPEAEVSAATDARYRQLLERRRCGEPMAYITGVREFWSLQLEVNEHTLIPRSDTETLVEWALELALPADASVADLGTGSGAIALALAAERPDWNVIACDSSAPALAVARRNAHRLKLDQVCFMCSDWGAALPRVGFDALVSNPPYVAEGDPHLRRGDLRYEPVTALSSGSDGLNDIRAIVSQSGELLRPGGWLLLEHGFEQASLVCQLLQDAGFGCVTTRCDLAGQPRISGGIWA